MKRLEVRCGCMPQKLLGYMLVPDDAIKARVVRVRFYDRVDLFIGLKVDDTSEAALQPRNYRYVPLPIERRFKEGAPSIAVKAEGLSIEELRRLPNFEEAT